MDESNLKTELAEVNQAIEDEKESDSWDCLRLKKLVQKKERIVQQLYKLQYNNETN